MKTLSPRLQSMKEFALSAEPFFFPREFAALRDCTSISIAWEYYLEHMEIQYRKGDLLLGRKGPIDVTGFQSAHPEIVERYREWVNPPLPHTEWFKAGFCMFGGNHMIPGFAGLMQEGVGNRIERIRRRLSFETDPEKRGMLQAMERIGNGIRRYGLRCGGYLRRLAEAETDESVRRELVMTAETAEASANLRPRNFREACQLAAYIFLIVPDSPGLPDQYLYSFYLDGIRNKTLTDNDAFEYISAFFILIYGTLGKTHDRGGVHHLSLGGSAPDGTSRVNPLSRICMEAAISLNLIRPQIAVRWSETIPDDFMDLAADLLRSGNGSPDFSNDSVFFKALTRIGISPEDASEYSPSGCNEVMIPGKAHMGAIMGHFNCMRTLTVLLGYDSYPDGVSFPFPEIDSFEEFLSCWKKSAEHLIDILHEISYRFEEIRSKNADHTPMAFFTENCINTARGISSGGALYNFCNWDATGFVNLVNALYTLKILVFEEKKISLRDFAEVLRNDWNGSESLRAFVRNKIPRFGNAESGVDELASRIFLELRAILDAKTPFRGGHYLLGTLCGYENVHVLFGDGTPATPDGRFNGDAFASGLNASGGDDRKGITSHLRSVSSMPTTWMPTSTVVNLVLDPALLRGENGNAVLRNLVGTHFRNGGIQLQITLADREKLLSAQRNPEKYSGLTVRVAGYSAKFTSLTEPVQNEIIRRNFQGS